MSVGIGIVCIAVGLYGVLGQGETTASNLVVLGSGLALFLQAYLLNKK